MILVADSGSSKTQWASVHEGKTEYVETVGMNPYFTKQNVLQTIVDKIKSKTKSHNIDEIHFFGAGCNSDEKSNLIRNLFEKNFKNSEIEVDSDLVGAAKALFQNKKGIAVILGTGSNTGFYDGKKIKYKTPSLGYILGDEGSGSNIGKIFISKLLLNEFSNKIIKKFNSEYNLNLTDILECTYKKPNPNKFLATFMYFISKNINEKEIKDIVNNSFDSLITKHI